MPQPNRQGETDDDLSQGALAWLPWGRLAGQATFRPRLTFSPKHALPSRPLQTINEPTFSADA